MNRATALLLAMATLLAHALAVHRDEDGSFGQPYEVAHEAYHLGRNLVREGSLAWNPAAEGQDERGGLGTYASPLWVGGLPISRPFAAKHDLIGVQLSLAPPNTSKGDLSFPGKRSHHG